MSKVLSPGTYFMQGNKALAEGAVAAGCRFFAGYPITPASEIAEHLAVRLPHIGGIMIQMEDEIASLASVIGASWAGTKSMTATSGPGFSLMQESIGYAFMTETPCVIVDVQRAGPSTGQATKGGQGDVMQARWGTHGDYASIVLSPNSVQEMYDLTIRAFNLAEEFRTPVILLSDEVTSHMREQITVPPADHVEIRTRTPPRVGEPYFGGTLVPPMPSVGEGFDVVVTGSTHNEAGLRFTADPTVHSALVTRLVGKIEVAAQSMMDCETFNLDGCDVGFISFGCTSRAVYEAVETLEEQGISAGFVRLRTIWPFPEKYVRELAEQAHVVIVPEMNLKQIYYEVQRVVDGAARVVPVNQIGGGELVTPETLCHVAKEATDKS